jgi:cell division protein FtsW
MPKREVSRASSVGINLDKGLTEMFNFGWNRDLFKRLAKKFSFEQKRRKRPEYAVLIIAAVLIALGTLTLYAIGPAVFKRTGGGLGRQTVFILMGLVGMTIAYKLPKPELLIRLAPYIFGLGILLCTLILIPGVGKVVYGGRRWIDLGPFGSMQPSELVKAGIVFFLSGMAIYFKDSGKNPNQQVAYFVAFGALIATFILLLQKDLGTMLVISVIMLFILVASEVNRKVILKILGLGVVMLLLSIMMFGYRRERLFSFFGKTSTSQVEEVESPSEYHLRQSLIAVGSGGIYGRGVGKSVQSFGYLPEAPSDSIFAVYAEKFGLLGSIALLTLFGALIKRMLGIMNGLDGYWKSVVAGITGWVAGNFVVNMGSILGLIPFTGVPLPFFSLGGTNLVIMLTMIGVVLNLSAYKKSRMNGFGEQSL